MHVLTLWLLLLVPTTRTHTHTCSSSPIAYLARSSIPQLKPEGATPTCLSASFFPTHLLAILASFIHTPPPPVSRFLAGPICWQGVLARLASSSTAHSTGMVYLQGRPSSFDTTLFLLYPGFFVSCVFLVFFPHYYNGLSDLDTISHLYPIYTLFFPDPNITPLYIPKWRRCSLTRTFGSTWTTTLA